VPKGVRVRVPALALTDGKHPYSWPLSTTGTATVAGLPSANELDLVKRMERLADRTRRLPDARVLWRGSNGILFGNAQEPAPTVVTFP